VALHIRRLHVLSAALAGIGAFVLLSPPPDETVVVSTATTRPHVVASSAKPSVAAGERLLAIIPRALPASDVASSPRIDLFVNRRLPLAPVPPPAMLPASQAMPLAPPPLPFKVIGKKLEGGAWEVFLLQENETLVASVGERVGTIYKIESIAPPVMTLTYLPLNVVQTLQIGDVQ